MVETVAPVDEELPAIKHAKTRTNIESINKMRQTAKKNREIINRTVATKQHKEARKKNRN